MPTIDELRMVKFYVVDGISYPAAEAAVGVFDKHGYVSMAMCRSLGFSDASAKGSLNSNAFSERVGLTSSNTKLNVLVNPLEHYLSNHGFGVKISSVERELARLYLVDGLTYTGAEIRVGIHGRRGFEAMYAVCKIGAFKGRHDRRTMTELIFEERLKQLLLI